jgi:magnesium transporter
MVRILVHEHGVTSQVEAIDPAWIAAGSQATLWVDLVAPTPDEQRLLTDVFAFHPLAVEDALSAVHHPKVETYDGYLYLILHRLEAGRGRRFVRTQDVDFFLGPTYLVTVHAGATPSIEHVQALCGRQAHAMSEGAVALLHRVVDALVDNYRPVVDQLEARISRLEEEVFEERDDVVRSLLALKHDLAALRRVLIPQRDALGRLARREFDAISQEMAYRFRDVHDNLVRLAEEAILFQDRVTGILDAHLSLVSNRLNPLGHRCAGLRAAREQIVGSDAALHGIHRKKRPRRFTRIDTTL